MTTQYVLQFIAGRRPCGVDEADLPWQSVPGHVYADQGEGWAAVDEFDAAFDHRYTHRIKPVDVEDERATEPAPPPVAAAPPPPPPPAKKTVVRKVLLNRQLVEHRAQQAFDRNLGLLRLELGLESARRHLDPLLELCDMYLASAGSSLLTQRYREQLTEVRALVAARGNLRLVK